MSEVFDIKEKITLYSRIISHLEDVMYIMSVEDTDEAKQSKLLIESIKHKYEQKKYGVDYMLHEIQNKCDHSWVFSNYGSGGRMMRCLNCTLLLPENRI